MGFITHVDESIFNMQKLLDYIYANNIELCIGDKKETVKCLSQESFSKMIKNVLGVEYDYILNDYEESVEIINIKDKYIVGTIYGRLEYGYIRGDFRETPLRFDYAISKNNVFMRNKNAGYIYSEKAIRYGKRYGGMLVINGSTRTLDKYDEAELVWSTPIPANSTQCYYFCPMLDYPDETFPNSLVCIFDQFTLHFFYEETGEYYGKYSVKRSLKRVDD